MKRKPKRKMSWWEKALIGFFGLIVLFYLACFCMIFALRSVDPPTTMVQVEREVDALLAKKAYHARYSYVGLSRISPSLQYAVIAAEDERFYVHHGFDWEEMHKVVKSDIARRTIGRGASTITQQLVKNLFLGTERSFIRKGVEFTLVPFAEMLLTKNRILELYLNVIEWGPGVYGAEAASESWYKTTAAELNREQATRLAAMIPAPLRRTPAHVSMYAENIDERMKMMGW